MPQHRFTPLKESWLALYKPVTEQLKLDMRMNLKTRKVEIKTTKETAEVGFLQKAADFVQAFILGFDVADAIALLRLDDLYLESFEIKDVKVCCASPTPRITLCRLHRFSRHHMTCARTLASVLPPRCALGALTGARTGRAQTLRGEHLSRTIGRISGKQGKTKFTIENSTRTRIVLADTHIHILGSFANIKVARYTHALTPHVR